jgi:hypothetical protein
MCWASEFLLPLWLHIKLAPMQSLQTSCAPVVIASEFLAECDPSRCHKKAIKFPFHHCVSTSLLITVYTCLTEFYLTTSLFIPGNIITCPGKPYLYFLQNLVHTALLGTFLQWVGHLLTYCPEPSFSKRIT